MCSSIISIISKAFSGAIPNDPNLLRRASTAVLSLKLKNWKGLSSSPANPLNKVFKEPNTKGLVGGIGDDKSETILQPLPFTLFKNAFSLCF